MKDNPKVALALIVISLITLFLLVIYLAARL